MQKACHRFGLGILSLSLLSSLALPTMLAAQDSSSGGPISRLTVHGYLTQAYATADFAQGGVVSPAPDEVDIGIPEGGTFDYRNLAIQFRYDISPKDIMVVQFSNRSLGDSLIQLVEDEIELDWAFYERRLSDSASIKVGRVQIPSGIFNEIRDVGTLLPFFRPSFVIYREGTLTSETVDGVVYSQSFGGSSNWAFDFDFYVGGWDLAETDPFDPTSAKIARAEDGIGFQFWADTPVSGLRFGVAGHQENVTDGVAFFRGPDENQRRTWLLYSVELLRDRFVLRAEDLILDGDPTSTTAGLDASHIYVQLGFMAHEKLWIYLQGERGNGDIQKENFKTPFPVTDDINFDFRTDIGIALNFNFSPNVVLKFEHHITEFEQFTFVPVIPMGGPPPTGLSPVLATADDGAYTILSLSASF